MIRTLVFFPFSHLFFYPTLVKKESIKDLVRKQYKVRFLVLISTAILMGILQWTISPKLLSMYSLLQIPVPFITQISSMVTTSVILVCGIFAVYFLASSLPTFQFLDFAVKGSVAVYFFGLLGVNEWIVIFISTLMWFLNIVLPVVIGSYYVLNFKSKWKQ